MINKKKTFGESLCSEQKILISNLENDSFPIHSVENGTLKENDWRKWLKKFLPHRYSYANGHVIDYKGNVSEQIDIIIYDNFYSPCCFEKDDVTYVPMESVYAIFEIKPEISTNNIKYAEKKAASVLKLSTTNGGVNIITGTQIVKKNQFKPIVGLLATKNKLKTINGSSLNIIFSIDGFLDISYMQLKFVSRDKESILAKFYFKLFQILQTMGNAPAIDINRYEEGK